MDTAERLEVKQLGLNVFAETLSKCGLSFKNPSSSSAVPMA